MTQEQIKAEIHKIVDLAIDSGLHVTISKGHVVQTSFFDGWENHKVTSMTEVKTYNYGGFDYTPLNRHIETVKQKLSE